MPTTALFPVSVGHKTGFIDAKGRVVSFPLQRAERIVGALVAAH